MAKKENNRKNYSAREAWEKRKRVGRFKQVWSPLMRAWARVPFTYQDYLEKGAAANEG